MKGIAEGFRRRRSSLEDANDSNTGDRTPGRGKASGGPRQDFGSLNLQFNASHDPKDIFKPCPGEEEKPPSFPAGADKHAQCLASPRRKGPWHSFAAPVLPPAQGSAHKKNFPALHILPGLPVRVPFPIGGVSFLGTPITMLGWGALGFCPPHPAVPSLGSHAPQNYKNHPKTPISGQGRVFGAQDDIFI